MCLGHIHKKEIHGKFSVIKTELFSTLKWKIFSFLKTPLRKQRQGINWEKSSPSTHIRGLAFLIYNETLLQIYNKKTTQLLKWSNDLNRHVIKEDI